MPWSGGGGSSGGGGGVQVLRGTAAARPAANSVPSGSLYIPSDSGNVFFSDGASWFSAMYGPASSVDALHAQVHGASNHAGVVGAWDFPCTYPLHIANSSLVWSSANRCVYGRSWGTGSGSNLIIAVTTSSGNLGGAVYANSGTGRGSVPGTLQASSGSVVTPAAGTVSIALGATVTANAGDWLALAMDNVTAAIRCTATVMITGSPANIALGFQLYQDTAFPPPASNPTTTGAGLAQALAMAVG
jgi:hypothetical protein